MMRNKKPGTSRHRLVIAFITGMVVTAVLAHTPLAQVMFSCQPDGEAPVPPVPAAPGLYDKEGSICELVWCQAGQAMPA
jgi:hypothetical protein